MLISRDGAKRRPAFRLAAAAGALLAALGTWSGSASGQFTPGGVICWIAAVTLAWYLVTPRRGNSPRLLPPSRLLLVGLGASLVLGAAVRFWAFQDGPPEMTSDHVEKLLDVLRIEAGNRPVYLGTNGGREPLHFYFLAVLRKLTGLPHNFPLLKLGSVLEGLLSILAAALLTRELVAFRNPAGVSSVHVDLLRADQAAVMAAVVLAISHWHVLLSRLGLRLMLSPLFFALVAILLARAVRTGSRRMFGGAGLVLGLSLFGYQANRALPVLVLAAVFLALPLTSGRERKLALLKGLATATLLAFLVALPLIRFMFDSPAVFWGRVSGRIVGLDETAVSLSGYAKAIRVHAPALLENLGRTLAMPFFRTDRSWFTGVPSGAPGLDLLSAGLLTIGLWTMTRASFRSRDPATWLPLLGLVLGLLPSAMAIARPGEVPHAARSGGALPFAAALAGSGGAFLFGVMAGEKSRGLRRWGAVALAVALASGAAVWNLRVYWNGAIVAYRTSAQPHRRASELIRLFETETAAPGNVFILPWPYWLDHRAVLLEAGRTDFDVVPSAPSDAAFAELVERRQGNSPYQPQLDVVFLVHPDDANGLAWLRSRYPEGTFSDFSRKGSGRLGLFRSPARGKRT